MNITDIDEMITTLDDVERCYRELLGIVEALAGTNTITNGGYPNHLHCSVCSGTPQRDLFDFIHSDDCPKIRAVTLLERMVD